MAEARSSVNAPMVAPVLMILKESSGDESVATTSAAVMGTEDGSGLEDGVAAGKQLFGIDVGNGAGGGDLRIALDKEQANGDPGAWLLLHGVWLGTGIG